MFQNSPMEPSRYFPAADITYSLDLYICHEKLEGILTKFPHYILSMWKILSEVCTRETANLYCTCSRFENFNGTQNFITAYKTEVVHPGILTVHEWKSCDNNFVFEFLNLCKTTPLFTLRMSHAFSETF